MSCPSSEQLAAAAAEPDATILLHLDGCLPCRAVFDAQREIAQLARKLPVVPSLPAARRARLAAEVIASADVEQPHRRRGYPSIAGGIAAAATVIAIAFIARHTEAPPPPVATIAPPPAPIVAPIEPRVTPTAHAAHAPTAHAPAAELTEHGADFTRSRIATRDTVELRDGNVTIDTRDREPLVVVARDTTVAIANARVEVVARDGVIVATHVFAGSIEITSAGRVIESADVWTPPQRPHVAVAADVAALAAFRTGWEALRAGHNADAIAAFDRATDPVIAEDAAFWAAIAAVRSNLTDDAARRLRGFLDKFPDSPHADAARAALASLAP